MSKETEELLIFAVVGFLFLQLMSNSSGAAGTLALAKVNSATNTAYAGDAADVIGDFTDMW